MMSPGGKLTALACHPTKNVNKAEELNYLSTDIQYIARCSVAIQGKEGGIQGLAGPAPSSQIVGSFSRVNHEQAKHSSGTTGANMLNKEAGKLTQEVGSFNFCLSSQPSGRIN
jgi:hypothetical protein